MAAIVVTTFELADGASVDGFMEADARYQQDVAYQTPGLLRRTTARSDDATWCVVEVWGERVNAVPWHDGELAAQVANVDRRTYDTLD